MCTGNIQGVCTGNIQGVQGIYREHFVGEHSELMSQKCTEPVNLSQLTSGGLTFQYWEEKKKRNLVENNVQCEVLIDIKSLIEFVAIVLSIFNMPFFFYFCFVKVNLVNHPFWANWQAELVSHVEDWTEGLCPDGIMLLTLQLTEKQGENPEKENSSLFSKYYVTLYLQPPSSYLHPIHMIMMRQIKFCFWRRLFFEKGKEKEQKCWKEF